MENGGSSSGFQGYHQQQKLPKSNSDSGLMMSSSNSTPAIEDNSMDAMCMVREQDRFMPIANVIRIMRKVLPTHAKISDDAKETIQECVSEYISFITSEANERCQREQRKTITAEDVLWAMNKLGFDDYVEPLSLYLRRYREFEGDRGSIRGDPLLKQRSMDLNNAAYAASAFHMVHQQGFMYGTAAMGGAGGGYFRDGSNVGNPANQAAMAAASFDPYVPRNM